MNDNDVLDDVRASVAGVHMDTPVAAIISRGRAHRRRRSVRLLAGTGAGLAVAGVGLAAIVQTAAEPSPGNGRAVRLASFSVVENPDHTATLTLTKGQAVDTGTLTARLAEAGVPAQITNGRFCRDSVPDGAAFERVVSLRSQDDGTVVMVITPAAMPSGAKLSIGVFPDGQTWNLATDGAPQTCIDELD
jgi:hypothetical protein